MRGVIMESEVFVGLDIGTTKVACIITELGEDSELKVIGVGVCPAVGMHKGVVVNIEKTVSSIKKAVEEAELMAGVDVDAVWVGIAGEHIRAINSRGVVAIAQEGRSDNEITKVDVDRAIGAAKAVAIPGDREILHVIAQEFSVDAQGGIKDPVGMCGARLETQVHIITGAIASAQNIMKCVEKAGLKVIDLVLEPLASSYAVLNNDEKELGVALVDIGGGTTDIAIYLDESIRHSAVVGLGGKNVTKDIAIGLRTPVEKAEEIKRKYGCAYQPLLRGKDETFMVPGVGGHDDRNVSKDSLVGIIEPRMEEILSLVLREIKRTGFTEMLGAGVVLTGGGSLMEGVKDKAESIFQTSVKLGVPTRFVGLTEAARSPIHATGIGLCMYAVDSNSEVRSTKKNKKEDGGFGIALNNMVKWAKEFF